MDNTAVWNVKIIKKSTKETVKFPYILLNDGELSIPWYKVDKEYCSMCGEQWGGFYAICNDCFYREFVKANIDEKRKEEKWEHQIYYI